eukprot:5569010-Amphidinium_carterae.1
MASRGSLRSDVVCLNPLEGWRAVRRKSHSGMVARWPHRRQGKRFKSPVPLIHRGGGCQTAFAPEVLYFVLLRATLAVYIYTFPCCV